MAYFKAMISGLEALRRLKKAVPAATRAELDVVLRASAKAIAADARLFAPRGPTGLLKRSITAGGTGPDYAVGVTGSAARYAHFVEYGTSRHGARPFMRPAAQREADRMPGRIRVMVAVLPGKVAP